MFLTFWQNLFTHDGLVEIIARDVVPLSVVHHADAVLILVEVIGTSSEPVGVARLLPGLLPNKGSLLGSVTQSHSDAFPPTSVVNVCLEYLKGDPTL